MPVASGAESKGVGCRHEAGPAAIRETHRDLGAIAVSILFQIASPDAVDLEERVRRMAEGETARRNDSPN
jgi:hypothetical protein